MAFLLNFQTGEPEEVPDAQVTEAVGSGSYGLPRGRIAVRDAAGKPFELDAEEAAAAFQAGDFRYETDDERKQREAKVKYGGAGGGALAAGAGVLRGATLGLSDVALTETGLVKPSTLKAIGDVQPEASVGGEAVGTIASLLVPGAGEANAVKTVGKLGQLAERGAAKVLGAKAGGLAGKVATKAAGAAVEGSFYGAGHAISESAIEDTELTAQKVVAGAGMGALLGGAGGGLFGAVERGAVKTGQLVLGRKGAQDVAADGVSVLVTKARKDPVAAAGATKELLEAGAAENAGVIKRTLEALDLEFPSAEGWVLRDLDLKSRELKKLGMKDLTEDAPKMLLDDARFVQTKTLPEKLELIRTKQQEAGLAMSDAVSRLDGLANKGERFNAAEVAARARKELIKPLENGPAMSKPIREALEAEIERIEQLGSKGMSFSKAEEFKRGFDPYLKWDSQAPGPVKEGLRKLRGIINDEIESKAEAVAISRNDLGIFDSWKQAKKTYGAMAELGNAAESRVAARQGNRYFSLTDNLAGTAGLIAGGINPVGMAASAAGAMVNKWGRERLPHILATTLHRMRSGGPAAAKVTNAFQKSLSSALKSQPGKFGPYAGILTNASARGAEDLYATHVALHETDAAYGEAMAAAGFPVETPEQADQLRGKAERITQLEQAVAAHDKALDDAIQGFIKAKSAPASSKMPRAKRREATLRETERLAALASNPEALTEQLQLGSILSDDTPGVGAAVAATTARAVQFLHEKSPKRPNPAVVPALEKPWQPTDGELDRFARYAEAVNNPKAVLDDLRRGTVSREAVEALQAVYPQLADDIRARLLERIAGNEKRLSYRQRMALMPLLGEQVGLSSAASNVIRQAHQQAQAQEAAKQSRSTSGAAQKRLTATTQTMSQRIETRGAQ